MVHGGSLEFQAAEIEKLCSFGENLILGTTQRTSYTCTRHCVTNNLGIIDLASFLDFKKQISCRAVNLEPFIVDPHNPSSKVYPKPPYPPQTP
jgi:hypothetical protein